MFCKSSSCAGIRGLCARRRVRVCCYVKRIIKRLVSRLELLTQRFLCLNSLCTQRARRDYGQRWQAETLMSVLKRKWGECLSARDDAMQQLQALLRGVVYNVHRLTVLGVFCCLQLLLDMLLQRTID